MLIPKIVDTGSDELVFIEAILEECWDLGAWLIYADWLLDQSPEREAQADSIRRWIPHCLPLIGAWWQQGHCDYRGVGIRLPMKFWRGKIYWHWTYYIQVKNPPKDEHGYDIPASLRNAPVFSFYVTRPKSHKRPTFSTQCDDHGMLQFFDGLSALLDMADNVIDLKRPDYFVVSHSRVYAIRRSDQ
jgi:uncharacterized protein (TIGR02996 family)